MLPAENRLWYFSRILRFTSTMQIYYFCDKTKIFHGISAFPTPIFRNIAAKSDEYSGNTIIFHTKIHFDPDFTKSTNKRISEYF